MLVIMPLSFWASQLQDWIDEGYLRCYQNADCSERLTKTESDNILRGIDTVADENGNIVVVSVKSDLPYITVTEKWQFDTNTGNNSIYSIKIR
jgi:hypothetical protein